MDTSGTKQPELISPLCDAFIGIKYSGAPDDAQKEARRCFMTGAAVCFKILLAGSKDGTSIAKQVQDELHRFAVNEVNEATASLIASSVIGSAMRP